MPGISIHVVDVARGTPATGMYVEVFSLSPARQRIADGQLGPVGALDHPIVQQQLAAGPYEVIFHAGAFFAAHGVAQSQPPFLDQVPFRLTVSDSAQHVHLPMKITPWGYSLFRGS